MYQKRDALQYSEEEEAYYISCDANPGPLTFVIGGNNYQIQPENYIITVSLYKEEVEISNSILWKQ